MNIIEKSLSQIKPYKRNSKKHDQTQIDNVAESLRQYGAVQPIVIDKDNYIVIGHCRALAAKQLGWKTFPCISVDDLTPEQVNALRIVDNKTNESAWDLDMLELELPEIDLSDFDFSFGEKKEKHEQAEEDDGYYGDERERTFNTYNLYDIDLSRVSTPWQMPIIRKETHIPEDLISFNYVLNTDAFDKGVHFYIDDYQFERIWSDPHKYMERLTNFDCCLTPDFSTYTEMPLPMQMWNVFRSRLIGQIMQDYGIKVIPTLQWCMPDSYQFCFEGIEQGGTVSVSTIGVKRDAESKQIWFDGMDEAIKRLKPSCVLIYGGDIGYDFGNVKAVYVENKNAERLKNA